MAEGGELSERANWANEFKEQREIRNYGRTYERHADDLWSIDIFPTQFPYISPIIPRIHSTPLPKPESAAAPTPDELSRRELMKQLPYTTEEEPLKEPTMEDLLKEVDTRCIIMDPDRPPRIQPGITLLEVNTDLRKIVYKMSFERRDGMVREVEPPWSDHNSCSFVGYLSLEHYRDEFQEQIFDSVNLQHSIGYPKPLFFDYTSDGVKTSMSTKSVARRRARGRSRGTPNDNRQPRHWPTP